MRAEEVTFAMRAGNQDLKESYLLTAGFFDNGTPMNHEQVRDLLELKCESIIQDHVDTDGFDDILTEELEELGQDVEDRNAAFFLEQEALIDATHLDLEAQYDAKIRDLQVKEATATKESRKAPTAAQELKLRQEARRWQRKADDLEDDYRKERDRLRDESDELLNNAQEALQASQSRHTLFTNNWEVVV